MNIDTLAALIGKVVYIGGSPVGVITQVEPLGPGPETLPLVTLTLVALDIPAPDPAAVGEVPCPEGTLKGGGGYVLGEPAAK
ncbi:MAG: hypothetical protein J5746_12170 [Victivallales bacterium]|nr:hypothetical protein [Victivallales bacterium]